MRIAYVIAITPALAWPIGTILADEEVSWKERACLRMPEPNDVGGVKFSVDGKQILAFGHAAIVIWNVEEAKELHRINTRDMGSVMGSLTSDGKKVFLVDYGKFFAFYDLKSKQEEKRRQLNDDKIYDHYHVVALSPHEKMIAVGGETHTATLLDAKTLKEIGKLEGHFPVCKLAFTPDNKSLVTIPLPNVHVGKAPRSEEGNIIVWDIAKRERRLTLELHTAKYMVDSFTISSDSKLLATASGGEEAIRIWDLTTGKETDRFYLNSRHPNSGTQVAGLSFSPDSKLLAVAGTFPHQLVLIDMKTSHFVCKFEELFDKRSHGPRIGSVAFSPDGKLLAVGCSDKTVRLFEIKRRMDEKENKEKEK